MIQTAAVQCLGLGPGASAQFMGLEVALKNEKGKKKKKGCPWQKVILV